MSRQEGQYNGVLSSQMLRPENEELGQVLQSSRLRGSTYLWEHQLAWAVHS